MIHVVSCNMDRHFVSITFAKVNKETDLPHYKRSVPLRLLFQPAPCSIDFLVFTPREVAKWNGTVNHIITKAFETGNVVYER